MPVLPPKAGGKRKRPSMRGVMMADVSQGAERLRAWPRKRPGKPSEKQLEQREWFRKAQWAYRYQDPKIQQAFAEATEDTPFMPRDLFTQMLAGRFCFVRTSDGKLRSPMAALIDVSASLDVITQTPGFTLKRGEQYWEGGVPAAGGVSGVRCIRNTNIAAWGPAAPMAWQATAFDDNGSWNIANPTRLVVPTGITRANITFNACNEGGSATNVSFTIRDQAGVLHAVQNSASGFGNQGLSISTGLMSVTPGQWFEGWINLANASGKTWQANRCSLAAEFYG